jgi:glutamate dehydrogenase (NAD(P)+)
VVGLPCEVGGIPLDEVGATGWGLVHATEVAIQYCDFELKGARVVFQGFGAVGKHAAHFLTQRGAILVGVADSEGAVHNPDGLDVDTLIRLKKEGKSVLDYPGGKKLDSDAVIGIPCDIWIPAARPDVINESNVHLLNTKLIIEGANIPITEGAEKILYEAGILYVPDFIANAGGVICAASEYRGVTQCTALGSIEEKVRNNTAQVLEAAKTKGILPREAAVQLALKRVKRAMGYRRWSIFSSAPGFV